VQVLKRESSEYFGFSLPGSRALFLFVASERRYLMKKAMLIEGRGTISARITRLELSIVALHSVHRYYPSVRQYEWLLLSTLTRMQSLLAFVSPWCLDSLPLTGCLTFHGSRLAIQVISLSLFTDWHQKTRKLPSPMDLESISRTGKSGYSVLFQNQ